MTTTGQSRQDPSDRGKRGKHETVGFPVGLTDQEWSDAVREVREAILEAAYERRMTWYGEVASQVTCIRLDPYFSLMNHL